MSIPSSNRRTRLFRRTDVSWIRCHGLLPRCVFYGDLYPNQECYDPHIAVGLKQLMQARKEFGYGEHAKYFQEHNCIGFIRKGDRGRRGCAVLISNADRPRDEDTDR